jgi:ribosomal protein S18 acetylase RimI-like enzyme
MPSYRIVKTKDRDLIEYLHDQCFPNDSFDGTDFWVVLDGSEPVGFATGRKSEVAGNWYMLTRAGVLKQARGQGLQRRLIRVRVAHARKNKYEGCVTYVANRNSASAINVLRSGFELYDPLIKSRRKWVKKKRNGFVYFNLRF